MQYMEGCGGEAPPEWRRGTTVKVRGAREEELRVGDLTAVRGEDAGHGDPAHKKGEGRSGVPGVGEDDPKGVWPEPGTCNPEPGPAASGGGSSDYGATAKTPPSELGDETNRVIGLHKN